MDMRTPVAPWLRTLGDLVIATVVATVAAQYRDASLQDVLIGTTMAVSLVARRRSPVQVMAIVSTLALLQVLVCPSVPAGYDIAVLIAMVAVVTHSRQRWPALLAGAVVALGVMILAVNATVVDSSGSWLNSVSLSEYVTLLLACAALWLFAYVLRAHRENALVMAERAATAERERDHLARLAAADERAAIARELHDVVAHSLAVMIAQADGAGYTVGRDVERAAEAMRTVAGTGRDALHDMHRLVAVLRGASIDEAQPDRRRTGREQLEMLAGRACDAGLRVGMHIGGETRGLSAAEELTVVRLVQEGLTNTLRHAGSGASVAITVQIGAGEAVVEVTDDGGAVSGVGGATADVAGTPDGGGAAGGETISCSDIGEPVGNRPMPVRPVGGRPATTVASLLAGAGSGVVRRTGGNGLVGMRERVAVHGGEFTAGPKSSAGPGWRIRAVIPLKVPV